MSQKFKVSAVINASPEKVYDAWLNSEAHSAFTGAKASVSAKVGGKFTAWDGYISGKNLELHPGQKIVQSWRTTEFPEGAPDSLLEILLEESAKGTKVTFIHSDIPDGQAESYKKGWKEYYFYPMKEFFKK